MDWLVKETDIIIYDNIVYFFWLFEAFLTSLNTNMEGWGFLYCQYKEYVKFRILVIRFSIIDLLLQQ